MIEEYRFGLIKILGNDYRHDVKVYWDGKVLPWQRKRSHVVSLEDIQEALGKKPDLIIVGTGAYGVAKITEEAKREIEARKIELVVDKTGEAVKTFNVVSEASKEETGEQKRVIGLLHLTC